MKPLTNASTWLHTPKLVTTAPTHPHLANPENATDGVAVMMMMMMMMIKDHFYKILNVCSSTYVSQYIFTDNLGRNAKRRNGPTGW